jgi:CBS domain-containing protein
MLVRDLMTEHPITISPNARVRTALQMMLEHNFHHLPVRSAQGHIVGLVDDRACQHALLHTGDALIAEVMRTAPTVIEPHANPQEAARLMLTQQLRCLPVMQGETLVGILTTSDLLIALLHSQLIR